MRTGQSCAKSAEKEGQGEVRTAEPLAEEVEKQGYPEYSGLQAGRAELLHLKGLDYLL